MIRHLRDVLARGANVIPDPKRPGFYEVKLRGQLYFIYISPPTGKVLLIAGWNSHESVPAEVEASGVALEYLRMRRLRKLGTYC